MSALDITLSPEEKTELKRRVRSATIPQREGRRARIILLAAEGETRDSIARLTGFSCPTITDWCQRFQAHQLDGLIDKPGRGRKSPLRRDSSPCPGTDHPSSHRRTTLELSEHGKGGGYFLDYRP